MALGINYACVARRGSIRALKMSGKSPTKELQQEAPITPLEPGIIAGLLARLALA
jgi:hypothetical protein